MDNSDSPVLMRVADVARELNVSRSKAYELIASGEIRVVRLGRSVRVSRRALLDWVASTEETHQ